MVDRGANDRSCLNLEATARVEVAAREKCGAAEPRRTCTVVCAGNADISSPDPEEASTALQERRKKNSMIILDSIGFGLRLIFEFFVA